MNDREIVPATPNQWVRIPPRQAPERLVAGPRGGERSAQPKRGVESLYWREQVCGPQHHVKPAASTDEQCGSRAEHATEKATSAKGKDGVATVAGAPGGRVAA